MVDLIKPWEINLMAQVHKGMVWWLLDNGWTKEDLLNVPTEKDVARVEKIALSMMSPKNWIVCYSSSPSYIRYMMRVAGSVWALTTKRRLMLLSYRELAEVLMDHDSDVKYMVSETDLLILSYSDPLQPLIAKFRGSFAELMLQRKQRKLPTVTDIQIPKSVKSRKDLISNLGVLEEFFGKIWLDLFTKEDAKYLLFKD